MSFSPIWAVYSVCAKGGDLWPVLVFQKSGLIYACLLLVEENERVECFLYNELLGKQFRT